MSLIAKDVSAMFVLHAPALAFAQGRENMREPKYQTTLGGSAAGKKETLGPKSRKRHALDRGGGGGVSVMTMLVHIK